MESATVGYSLMHGQVCATHHEYGPLMACPFPGCPKGVAEDSIACAPPGLPDQIYRRVALDIGADEPSYVWMEDKEGMLLRLTSLLQRDSRRLDLTGERPDTVYHYTSPAGFLGIISGRAVWLSDYAYLNDVSEVEHGLSLAREVFAQTAAKRPKAAALLERWAQCRHDDHRVCVASFSRQGDSLSQWRGYGPIAIGFDPVEYPGFGDFRTARWGEVIYDTAKQKRQLELLAHLTASAWEYDAGYIPDRVDTVYGDGVDHMLGVAAFFKNQGFEDEREVRLVHAASSGLYALLGKTPPSPSFRPSGELIVPYLTTADITDNKPSHLPICDVVVGPSPQAETIARGLREVLLHNGYDDVPVRLSTTPFRR
ncbi:DUF2971 domain-containing protein [Caulobacter sp.]|uniref:DUF2971 domain-containing protein n=1 Tax=Caulobacter sp. TaxID=78 RepID=UPI0031D3D878